MDTISSHRSTDSKEFFVPNQVSSVESSPGISGNRDFPSLKESYGGNRDLNSNPRIEDGGQRGSNGVVITANPKISEVIASVKEGMGKDLSNDLSKVSNQNLIIPEVSVPVNEGACKNMVKTPNQEWRALFPMPRVGKPSATMKFTAPVEVNGRLLVAAESEKFPDGQKYCENMVVGFFVGERLSFAAVQLAVGKLWKFKKEVSIKLYDDCAFIFEFKDDEDRRLMLDTGSFYIAKKLFTLRPWSRLLEKSISEVKTVPIWAQIYGVPLHLWNNDGLGMIASYLGNPLFADECTLNQERLAYARVCIEIGLDFAYPSSIPLLLDGKIAFDLPVEYQWKPQKCDVCMVFGHTTKTCAKKKKNKNRWTPKKIGKPVQETIDKNAGRDGNVITVSTDGDQFPLSLRANNASINKEEGAREVAVDGDNASMEETVKKSVGNESSVNPTKENNGSGSGSVKLVVQNPVQNPEKHSVVTGDKNALEKQSSTVESANKSVNSGLLKLVVAGVQKKGAKVTAEKDVGAVKPTEKPSGSGSAGMSTGVQNEGEWKQAKGKKFCARKALSPKKNPFIMLSDFPYQSSSRFPIDRRKESVGDITPVKNRFHLEELEEGSEEQERNMDYVSVEDEYSKKQERELHRLQWNGNPKETKEDQKNLGRGCRSQAKK